MKKPAKLILACLMAALMLALSFPAPVTAASDIASFVRVRLDSMGNPSSLTMEINGVYYIQEDPSIELVEGRSYTFTASGGQICLNGKALADSITLIRCKSSNTANYLSMNNPGFGYKVNYPGNMTLDASGRSMTLYCRVYMEDYLCGVLIGEMGNNKPLEALKAQAVAARTFAVNRSKGGSGSYDVNDTTDSQVYKGYVTGYSNIINAVNATKGQVLYWKGSISDGLYSACNGGQTQLASLKWNMKDTYHTLKDDPYDLKGGSDHKSFDFVFYKEGKGTTDSRATSQVIEAASKKLGVSESKIKVLGFTSVEPFGRPDGYPEESRVRTDLRLGVVLSVNGVRKTETLEFDYKEFRVPFYSSYSRLSVMRNIMDVTETDEAITLTVRGWGHGVGLSQAGAIGRANAGIGYRDILDFYYTGCTLETLDQKANTLPDRPDYDSAEKPEDDEGLEVTAYGIAPSTGSVNVYLKGEENATLRGTLKPNRVVEVFEKGSTWTKIRFNNAVGYVKTRDLTVQSSNPLQPIVATGTVKVETQLRVRLEPNTTSGILTKLNNGETVQILEVGKTFHKIAYDVYIGYVSADYITVGDIQPTPTPTVTPSPTPTVSPTPTPTSEVKTGTVKVSNTLNVRKGPGTQYDRIGSVKNGVKVKILGEESGWYKIEYSGGVGYVSKEYIVLDGTKPTATPTATPDAPKTGTVKISSNTLNVRKGPGTQYDRIGSVKKGATVTILGEQSGWYKISYNGGTGYVSKEYVVVNGTAPSTTPTATATTSPPKTGTVKISSNTLNVRKGPGTQYDRIGSVKKGATVTILGEQSGWYKISYNGGTGYVSKEYVVVNGTAPSTTPTATATTSPPKTGTVKISSNTLNVRKGPGTQYDRIGSVKKGAAVTILGEQSGWYKISYNGGAGYVSKQYIQVGGSSATSTPTTPPTETKTGTVKVSSNTLNVRKGPGTGYARIGSLSNGAKVTITGEQNGWYKISYNGGTGYVSKEYIQAGGSSATTAPTKAPDEGTGTTGKVAISSGSLTVRKGPGTSYAKVGSLYKNDTVTILETGSDWHKISYGGTTAYVSAQYIQIQGASSGSGTATVHVSGTLLVRSGPGQSYSQIGSLRNGATVTITGQNGIWYQINYSGTKGYVHGGYLKF